MKNTFQTNYTYQGNTTCNTLGSYYSYLGNLIRRGITLTNKQNSDWNIFTILIEDYENAIASYATKFRNIIHEENNISNTLSYYFPASFILSLSSDKDVIKNIWALSIIVSENRKTQDFVPDEILRLFGTLGQHL